MDAHLIAAWAAGDCSMRQVRFIIALLLVIAAAVSFGVWYANYDPPPDLPMRIGPDGGPAPLTDDEFRKLQDWMRRNRDKL